MGLFSFFSKNKPAGESAPPRRSAKEARDPALPEKKRARRRLVGAIALALTVAIGLPMILDSEPKPLATDIAIQIPSRAPATRQSGASASSVAASATLDRAEEIVAPPAPVLVPAPAPAPKAENVAAPTESKPEALAKVAKVTEAPKVDTSVLIKAEPRPEAKRAEPKPVFMTDDAQLGKPAPAGHDAARALAILEGKPVAKAHDATVARFVVQMAAFASQDKVDELQAKLNGAGIKSYTQKVQTPAGQVTRIRVGPFANKEEAEKMRSRLGKIGLGGSLVPI